MSKPIQIAHSTCLTGNDSDLSGNSSMWVTLVLLDEGKIFQWSQFDDGNGKWTEIHGPWETMPLGKD